MITWGWFYDSLYFCKFDFPLYFHLLLTDSMSLLNFKMQTTDIVIISCFFWVSVDSLLLTYQFQLLVRLSSGEISFGE